MQIFRLPELLALREQQNQAWLEFLRAQSLSMGLYHLGVGQVDVQQPHTEDEVYYVVSGRASFRIGGDENRKVEPGSLLFVERQLEHRFVDVTEDLTVLVFFAPPEGSTS